MRRIKNLVLICFLILLSMLSLAAPKFFYGKSSWYGGRFHGRKTASGEIFDQNKLTAAHRTLPFGTILKVTNLSNNLSVQVKVTDRGPFIKGRVLDLSKKAALELKFTRQGVADIKAEIIFVPGQKESVLEINDGELQPEVEDKPLPQKKESRPEELTDKQEDKEIDAIIKSLKNNLEGKDETFDKEEPVVDVETPLKKEESASKEILEKELTNDKPIEEQLAAVRDQAKSMSGDTKNTFEQKIFQIFVIQLGAYSDQTRVEKFQEKLKEKNIDSYVTEVKRDQFLLYKVREKTIYRDLEQVKARAIQIQQMGLECFIVAKFFFGS